MTARRKRGFALLSVERRRELASQGGRAAQAAGTAHQFTSEEARIAGRIGGVNVSADREHMSRIGARGGKRRWAKPTDSDTPADTAD